ncbi:MAG: energy transducer TonB [Acidobacteriota bacterium]
MNKENNRQKSEGQVRNEKPRVRERFREEDVLFESYFHPEDRKIKQIAFIGAVVIHIIMLLMRFPTFSKFTAAEKPKENIVIVRKYVPPPPKVEKPKQAVQQKLTKKMPIPDPTPDEPEPIKEPEPEPEIELIPPDAEIMIGIPAPEAPPQQGPLIAGVAGVTNPELIPETKLLPVYPELARKAKIEGSVILQAVIKKDGTVGDIVILRSPGAKLGFEEAAAEAVKKWRYKPALQNGRPVDVYFTVEVNFTLL